MPNPTEHEVDAAMDAQAPIVKVEPGTLAESSSIIQRALDSGITAESLEKMYAVHERMCEADARRQFNAALAAFQQDCPAMPRSGTRTDFKRVNAKGVSVPGSYTTLDDMAKTIAPLLKANGLAYDWEKTESYEQGGVTWFRCHLRVRHVAGHSEVKEGPAVPMNEGRTTAADRAAASQARARNMALSYGLGLWSMSQDDLDQPPPAEPISEANARELRELLDSLEHVTSRVKRQAWERRMFAAFDIESIFQVPADKFDEVASKIQAGIEAAQP